MRFASVLLGALTVFTGSSVRAQSAQGIAPISAACVRLNQDALTRVAHRQSSEAEKMLSAALASADRPNSVCAGLIMSNIATLVETSGRLAEAEPMGQRAVHTLEESLPPGHPALARPLHILAAAQFQQGKITRARKTFKRRESIRVTLPEQRALVSALSAAMLEAEGKWPEAQSQIRRRHCGTRRGWARRLHGCRNFAEWSGSRLHPGTPDGRCPRDLEWARHP
jgi:ATP/maltotriose-dependent transcriptional regulator MalT